MPREASRNGYIRTTLGIYVPLPAGTGAAEIVTDNVPGFGCKLIKVEATAAIVYAGAGASRSFRVLKGASTVAASRTLVLADGATLGQRVTLALAATPSDRTWDDDDTLTVDFAAGGTAFTGGALNLLLTFLQHAQQRGTD